MNLLSPSQILNLLRSAEDLNKNLKSLTKAISESSKQMGEANHLERERLVKDLALATPKSLNQDPHSQIQPCAVKSDKDDKDDDYKGFNFGFNEMELEEAVYHAVGAASVCWSGAYGSGIFNDRRATAITEQLLERIRRAGPIYD